MLYVESKHQNGYYCLLNRRKQEIMFIYFLAILIFIYWITKQSTGATFDPNNWILIAFAAIFFICFLNKKKIDQFTSEKFNIDVLGQKARSLLSEATKKAKQVFSSTSEEEEEDVAAPVEGMASYSEIYDEDSSAQNEGPVGTSSGGGSEFAELNYSVDGNQDEDTMLNPSELMAKGGSSQTNYYNNTFSSGQKDGWGKNQPHVIVRQFSDALLPYVETAIPAQGNEAIRGSECIPKTKECVSVWNQTSKRDRHQCTHSGVMA